MADRSEVDPTEPWDFRTAFNMSGARDYKRLDSRVFYGIVHCERKSIGRMMDLGLPMSQPKEPLPPEVNCFHESISSKLRITSSLNS